MARPVRRAGPGIASWTATEAPHRRPSHGTTKSRAARAALCSSGAARGLRDSVPALPNSRTAPFQDDPASFLDSGVTTAAPKAPSSMRSASSSSASGSPASGDTTPVGAAPSAAATSRSTVTRTERALEDPSSQGISAAGASTPASGSALPDLADLAPELGFLELLEPEERAQWISGWLEPRVLRPRVRQHLRRRALLLELDEVVGLLAGRLSSDLGAYSTRADHPSRDCGQVAVSLRPGRLRARGPLDALGVQLIASCREAARWDVERAQGLRPVISTPRLLAVEALTGLTSAAACAWLARLHAAPLRVRLPWQARVDAWDGATLADPESTALEVRAAAPGVRLDESELATLYSSGPCSPARSSSGRCSPGR